MKTNITTIAGLPSGMFIYYAASTAPTGWLLCSGKTVGNSSSGGTARANADTVNLFTLLWNSLADTEAPVSGGRGISAAADFAANKTITLPDLRGRAFIGRDNMGGTAANRITSAGSGVDGTIQGNTGGAVPTELVGLIAANLPSHTHTISIAYQSLPHYHTYGHMTSNGNNNYPGRPGAANNNSVAAGMTTTYTNPSHTHTITVYAEGNGNQHSNLQPSVILNIIIKL